MRMQQHQHTLNGGREGMSHLIKFPVDGFAALATDTDFSGTKNPNSFWQTAANISGKEPLSD